ncbi:MAG: hypothetical protein E6Q95_02580 [Chitinophagaceae bacterium]|nr:MAG: hypothetical protein E6Q95_02580 [Chitinophagaceae bacterium]
MNFKILGAMLLMSWCHWNAQDDKGKLDSLSYASQKVMHNSDLSYGYPGKIYFLVSELGSNKIERSYILSPNSNFFDTVDLNSERIKILNPHLLDFVKGKQRTIISPFIFIENPKRGPNGNILYYDVVINNLFLALYNLTKDKTGSIILPINSSVKQYISASYFDEKSLNF